MVAPTHQLQNLDKSDEVNALSSNDDGTDSEDSLSDSDQKLKNIFDNAPPQRGSEDNSVSGADGLPNGQQEDEDDSNDGPIQVVCATGGAACVDAMLGGKPMNAHDRVDDSFCAGIKTEAECEAVHDQINEVEAMDDFCDNLQHTQDQHKETQQENTQVTQQPPWQQPQPIVRVPNPCTKKKKAPISVVRTSGQSFGTQQQCAAAPAPETVDEDSVGEDIVPVPATANVSIPDAPSQSSAAAGAACLWQQME